MNAYLWGLSPDAKVTYEVWLAGIHPDDRKRVEEATTRALAGERGGELDIEYRTIGIQDRVERWIAVKGTMIVDESGRAVRFLGTMRDISELRRAREALRESEERLRLALASAELGTWDFFPEARRVVWDKRQKELFGLPPGTEVTRETFYAGVHPDDRERVRKALDPGGRGEVDVDLEFRAIGQDRVERWLAKRGKVIYDDKGRRIRSLGATRDITEHHHFEELTKLLTGIFAHDLRSPVSAILMGSQLLLRHGNLTPESRKTAEIVARSAGRMAQMIEQLIDFTRVRFGGGIPLQLERVDLAALCREAGGELETANPGRQIRYRGPKEAFGQWDRVSLGRVMSNLLSNALQHGCADQPVDVALTSHAAEVVIEVTNAGRPIPEDVLPSIFDPFRRGVRTEVEHTGGGAGLGLGLYIAREIVLAHGGSVEVRSTQAEGTIFTVRLPRGG